MGRICCLLFLAFTAARSIEARLATWDEIDSNTATWHIPAARTKTGHPHAVPLSSQAIEVLRYAKERTNGEDLIFPPKRGGKCIDAVRLSDLMRRLNIPAVPHGMRSTFAIWAVDHGEITAHTAGIALALIQQNGVHAAFMADDFFQKRVPVMQMWADYLTETMGSVIPK